MANEKRLIDANALAAYLEIRIDLIKRNRHCYEVFDVRGERYPIENIYEEILSIVHSLKEMTK